MSIKEQANNLESVENLSFSQAFEELSTVANRFENEELSLEESIHTFERGMQLAKVCRERLNVLENQIEEIQTQYTKSNTNE